MTKDILAYIRSLSVKDKKTLSQKALKTCEEVGELAKAILPFDSAHGTNHRFVDREKILEEITDVFLTNISIAYSLDFTDGEIEEMIYKKTLKWNELQLKEEKANFPLPFEIHVTVDAIEMRDPLMCDSYAFDLDQFKLACQDIGVKPIVIDLEINGESDIQDVMTSSKHFGDNRSAYEESVRILNRLEDYGFKVVRNKIESVPWHPAAPTVKTGEPIPNGCYFESHIGVIITPDEKENLNEFVQGLNDRCTEVGRIELSGKVKLSQNFFKRSKDGSKFVNMITYRSNMTKSSEFIEQVDAIKWHLKECGFEFEKVEVEYAVYDTNTTHDLAWIKTL